jgi:NTP pyrophosphatase (non-canonical NTP hydrolase)
LNLNEYQELALRTANPGKKGSPPIQLNWAFGLWGESGEIAEIIKKFYWHGHSFDRGILEDELGDCLYYLAVLSDSFGIDLEQLALHNVEKLRDRYPEGFSEERSRNRDE